MGTGAEQGSTLIELLVAMAMAVVVFGATLTAFEVLPEPKSRGPLAKRSPGQRAQRHRPLGQGDSQRRRSEGRSRTAGSTRAGRRILGRLPDDRLLAEAGRQPQLEQCHARALLPEQREPQKRDSVEAGQKRWTTAAAPPLPAPTTTCPDSTAGHWDSSSQLAQHLTKPRRQPRVGLCSCTGRSAGPRSHRS